MGCIRAIRRRPIQTCLPFRDRGIFPQNVKHLAEDSLLWETPPLAEKELAQLKKLVGKLDLQWNLNIGRYSAFKTSETNRGKVRRWLNNPRRKALREAMGFERPAKNVRLSEDLTGEMRPIEVHSVRPCRRTAPDGSTHAMLVIEITQTFRAELNQARYRGGCTLLINLNTNEARYIVRKRLRGGFGADFQRKARAIAAERATELGVRFVEPGDYSKTHETFALMHRCAPRS